MVAEEVIEEEAEITVATSKIVKNAVPLQRFFTEVLAELVIN